MASCLILLPYSRQPTCLNVRKHYSWERRKTSCVVRIKKQTNILTKEIKIFDTQKRHGQKVAKKMKEGFLNIEDQALSRWSILVYRTPLKYYLPTAKLWKLFFQHYLLFFLLSHPKYFVAKCSHTDAHQRTDKIEDAIWQVSKRWHAEHRALCHTTGVPRNEH